MSDVGEGQQGTCSKYTCSRKDGFKYGWLNNGLVWKHARALLACSACLEWWLQYLGIFAFSTSLFVKKHGLWEAGVGSYHLCYEFQRLGGGRVELQYGSTFASVVLHVWCSLVAFLVRFVLSFIVYKQCTIRMVSSWPCSGFCPAMQLNNYYTHVAKSLYLFQSPHKRALCPGRVFSWALRGLASSSLLLMFVFVCTCRIGHAPTPPPLVCTACMQGAVRLVKFRQQSWVIDGEMVVFYYLLRANSWCSNSSLFALDCAVFLRKESFPLQGAC